MVGRAWLQAVVFSFLTAFVVLAHESNLRIPMERWIDHQQKQSFARIKFNITDCGAALAAQSAHYQKHWVRDAALISSALTRYYVWLKDRPHDPLLEPDARENLWSRLETKSRFASLIQNNAHPNPSIGLGAALYYSTGDPVTEEWGHPQNDGPALRALAHLQLIHAHPSKEQLVLEGERISEETLYAMIRTDINYVAANWHKASWDLWEEVEGKHFYTLMAQRRAIVEAIEYAKINGDTDSVRNWETQVEPLENEIRMHWDAERGYLIQTRDFQADWGPKVKPSNLDIATVLAVLHASDPNDDFFGVLDAKVAATVLALEDTFRDLYPINSVVAVMETTETAEIRVELGPAIGRYPEDKWDGFSRGRLGNPWFLATAALAQYYYVAAQVLANSPDRLSEIEGTEWFQRLGCEANAEAAVKTLLDKGDSFLQRIRLHATDTGELSEQLHRDSGYQTGPWELTWSHAAFLTAFLARQEAELAALNN